MTQDSIEREMNSLSLSGSPNPPDESTDSHEVQFQASDMQKRARLLLDELVQFQQYLKEIKQDAIYLNSFKSDVQQELKLLEKLSSAVVTDEKILHSLRSSNFTFFEQLWAAAKTCTGLKAFRKRFPLYPKGQMLAHQNNKSRSCQSRVDIVAQNGLEWVKVSSTTDKRIIWDLAKAGYAGSSDEDYSEDDDELDDSVGLLKQVKALVKASGAARIRYQHPSVRLVLPRIGMDAPKQVHNVLDQIRALGVTVQTAEDMPKQQPVAEVFHLLAADRFATFSATINLDCTILLAFVSDLSHGRVEPQDWHNKDIARQIKLEAEDQLLPSSLWPACGDRKLVCTREAVDRMHDIVNVVGTDTEKKRAALLIYEGREGQVRLTKEQSIEEFQKFSDYQIPMGWNIPVTVADFDFNALKTSLPPAAREVETVLIPINQSVFFYGWSSGLTTLSSNGSVAKAIEGKIEENRVHDEDAGPDVWLCSTSRSLVGKEKERRGLSPE